MSNIITQLKSLRGDLTYEQAAEKVGVTKQAWHNWETGYNHINLKTLEQVAVGFGKKLHIEFL